VEERVLGIFFPLMRFEIGAIVKLPKEGCGQGDQTSWRKCVSQYILVKLLHNCPREKISPKFLLYFCNFKNTA
jgi:hypothetical protein